VKYFKEEEFTCKCGCGPNKLQQFFLEKLDLARGIACVPFIINSGYRCEKHNAEEGSTSKNHTSGLAVDIRCSSGPDRLKIVFALLDVGFRRIGISKNFIHVDMMGGVSSIWVY
jgi:zinc D-Ala-D-Ala carboxypeptidase